MTRVQLTQVRVQDRPWLTQAQVQDATSLFKPTLLTWSFERSCGQPTNRNIHHGHKT